MASSVNHIVFRTSFILSLVIMCILLVGCSLASTPGLVSGAEHIARVQSYDCSVLTPVLIKSDPPRNYSKMKCDILQSERASLLVKYNNSFQLQKERVASDKEYHTAGWALGWILWPLGFLGCGVKGDDPTIIKDILQSLRELGAVEQTINQKGC